MERLGSHVVSSPDLPTKIIQFGEGNFLRAFVDWLVNRANQRGIFNGGVTIVQPRPGGHVAELEQQDRLYTVLVEGIEHGENVRSHDVVTSINATIDPYADWEGFLRLAEDPTTQVIVSNTTEAGIVVDPGVRTLDVAPENFPAKIAALLKRRHEKGLPGFLLLPCELNENNGALLRDVLIQTCRNLNFSDELIDWIEKENPIYSTLVDRIVPGFPSDQAEKLWSEFGYEDRLIVKAEPFYVWLIEGDEKVIDEKLPLRQAGLNVVVTDDISPYHDRKVFILNAPHTTMACTARLAGLETVGEVMADPTFRSFIDKEIHEEIFPVVPLPTDELEDFTASVYERFENPTVRHALDSIALNSVSKFMARLFPIVELTMRQGKSVPSRIVIALAGLLYIYSGKGADMAKAVDSPDVMAAFAAAQGSHFVPTILADKAVWGTDLTQIPGLADAVEAAYADIDRDGIGSLVKKFS